MFRFIKHFFLWVVLISVVVLAGIAFSYMGNPSAALQENLVKDRAQIYVFGSLVALTFTVLSLSVDY